MQIGQQVWCPRLKRKGVLTARQADPEVVPHWRVTFGTTTMSLREVELEPWDPLKLRQEQLWEELFYLSWEIHRLVEELQATIAEKDVARLGAANISPAFDRTVACRHRLMETHLMRLELEEPS